jgi:hypothetical protein
MKIYYEPHPVSPERKAELRGQGFKIVDAAFAPPGWTPPGVYAPVTINVPKPRGRPRKAS